MVTVGRCGPEGLFPHCISKVKSKCFTIKCKEHSESWAFWSEPPKDEQVIELSFCFCWFYLNVNQYGKLPSLIRACEHPTPLQQINRSHPEFHIPCNAELPNLFTFYPDHYKTNNTMVIAQPQQVTDSVVIFCIRNKWKIRLWLKFLGKTIRTCFLNGGISPPLP